MVVAKITGCNLPGSNMFRYNELSTHREKRFRDVDQTSIFDRRSNDANENLRPNAQVK